MHRHYTLLDHLKLDKWHRLFLTFSVLLNFLGTPLHLLTTPATVSSCSSPYNISDAPGYTSVDPLLLADSTGRIHLFWAERTTGEPGASPNIPDTLLYATWQRGAWSEPVDLFLSPANIFNTRIGGIRGDIDDRGRIHLVWMGPDNTFFYSSAYAFEAGNAQAWAPPILLANNQTGTQYSVDVAYEAPSTIHVLLGRDPVGANRVVSHMRSHDNGLTWSTPVDIHTFADFERGASNTRLLVHEPNRIYATWTEWDETGNGQVIYFARSLDSGLNWQRPVPLAVRVGDEYQRDWTNLAVVDEDTLVAFWSGGFRAYPQAQYSFDGGITWSEAIDTLYWLIADNGYAQFVQDNEGQTHLFVARRIREGYGYKCATLAGCQGEGNAIWHSVWQGEAGWREPQPVGGFQYGNYVTVAYDGGNQVFLSWFLYGEFDIHVMNCQMAGLAAAKPGEYPPTPTPAVTAAPDPGLVAAPSPAPVDYDHVLFSEPSPTIRLTTGNILLLSVAPSFIVVVAIFLWKRRQSY